MQPRNITCKDINMLPQNVIIINASPRFEWQTAIYVKTKTRCSFECNTGLAIQSHFHSVNSHSLKGPGWSYRSDTEKRSNHMGVRHHTFIRPNISGWSLFLPGDMSVAWFPLTTAFADCTHVLLASMPWTCRVLNEVLWTSSPERSDTNFTPQNGWPALRDKNKQYTITTETMNNCEQIRTQPIEGTKNADTA